MKSFACKRLFGLCTLYTVHACHFARIKYFLHSNWIFAHVLFYYYCSLRSTSHHEQSEFHTSAREQSIVYILE